MIPQNEAIDLINELGKTRSPFYFFCDFPGKNWFIKHEGQVNSEAFFKFNKSSLKNTFQSSFQKVPCDFDDYKNAFDEVVEQIHFGNSFLTNLTFKTQIETNLSLEDIYEASHAKYKVYFKDHFVVFSPETFVKIVNESIYSYPMKGTIDATIPKAEQILLEDKKEFAEHVTIVDLIRNDLSQIAEKVKVNRFRYVEEIVTNQKKLLQVSSEIEGQLPNDWREQLGTFLNQLLPAGSISGAPKPQTIQIIESVETYTRGFYTGICGKFDGESFDSGVMIRFIMKENDQLYYCSGGGITSFSQVEKEYQEMIDKIYLPFG